MDSGNRWPIGMGADKIDHCLIVAKLLFLLYSTAPVRNRDSHIKQRLNKNRMIDNIFRCHVCVGIFDYLQMVSCVWLASSIRITFVQVQMLAVIVYRNELGRPLVKHLAMRQWMTLRTTWKKIIDEQSVCKVGENLGTHWNRIQVKDFFSEHHLAGKLGYNTKHFQNRSFDHKQDTNPDRSWRNIICVLEMKDDKARRRVKEWEGERGKWRRKPNRDSRANKYHSKKWLIVLHTSLSLPGNLPMIRLHCVYSTPLHARFGRFHNYKQANMD
jgi:hypothetical protein